MHKKLVLDKNGVPPQEILEKYAKLMVRQLNKGKGIKPCEVVKVEFPECARPLGVEIIKQVWLAGGVVLDSSMRIGGLARFMYENCSDEQLSFCPNALLKEEIKAAKHIIVIDSVAATRSLEGIPSAKRNIVRKAYAPINKFAFKYGEKHKRSGTMCLYGTEAMAKEVGLSLRDYWDQICRACLLYEDDPIAAWAKVRAELKHTRNWLNRLKIRKVHIVGPNINLKIGLGNDRKWLMSDGSNMPSFETWISPRWGDTEGRIKFNNPLFMQGSRVSDIELTFEKGIVVKATASENEQLLQQFLTAENADKLGEFSLTEAGRSLITKRMGRTLFDENIGGQYGNLHIALGLAYKESYKGNMKRVSTQQWKKMQFNFSTEHTDIVSTENNTVHAILENGKQIVLFRKGKFENKPQKKE